MFDYLIVGAGFAGSVVAERLATQLHKKVLIVDRRPHIGGNAYDHYDDAGILVHKYGPHIFHTNGRRIYEYLSQFTAWRPYEHHVLAAVDGMHVPFPINIDTVNQLYGLHHTEADIETFFASVAEPVAQIRTSEDVVVSKVGRDLYEKFFRGYTRKQWGLDPSQLDAGVAARVPARMNHDDRYFTDTYQVMPLHGYTRMFERMLAHPNIKIMLNTDYQEIKNVIPYREMVYTGPIDEFFGYRYGKLPYRSLDFRFETHDTPSYQPEAVINYPNDHAYTRVTEFKYLTGQEHPKTSLVYEFPQAEGDPYYPVPRPENAERYHQYKDLADATPNVHFVGRLATYKYYNMDQVVGQALALTDRIVATQGDLLIESVPAWRATAPRLSVVPRRTASFARRSARAGWIRTERREIPTPAAALALWGGIESTVNRVGDMYFDQLERGGHARRIDDLDLIAALGIRTLRYPILWERTAPDGPARADWTWADERLNRLRELGIRPIVGLVHHGSGPPHTNLLDPAFAEGLARVRGRGRGALPVDRGLHPGQ